VWRKRGHGAVTGNCFLLMNEGKDLAKSSIKSRGKNSGDNEYQKTKNPKYPKENLLNIKLKKGKKLFLGYDEEVMASNS